MCNAGTSSVLSNYSCDCCKCHHLLRIMGLHPWMIRLNRNYICHIEMNLPWQTERERICVCVCVWLSGKCVYLCICVFVWLCVSMNVWLGNCVFVWLFECAIVRLCGWCVVCAGGEQRVERVDKSSDPPPAPFVTRKMTLRRGRFPTGRQTSHIPTIVTHRQTHTHTRHTFSAHTHTQTHKKTQ